MTKNIRITVFLENRLYGELLATKNEQKLRTKSDSQMVEHFLKQYLKELGSNALTIYGMRQQLKQQKEVIDRYQNQIEILKGEKKK